LSEAGSCEVASRVLVTTIDVIGWTSQTVALQMFEAAGFVCDANR